MVENKENQLNHDEAIKAQELKRLKLINKIKESEFQILTEKNKKNNKPFYKSVKFYGGCFKYGLGVVIMIYFFLEGILTILNIQELKANLQKEEITRLKKESVVYQKEVKGVKEELERMEYAKNSVIEDYKKQVKSRDEKLAIFQDSVSNFEIQLASVDPENEEKIKILNKRILGYETEIAYLKTHQERTISIMANLEESFINPAIGLQQLNNSAYAFPNVINPKTDIKALDGYTIFPSDANLESLLYDDISISITDKIIDVQSLGTTYISNLQSLPNWNDNKIHNYFIPRQGELATDNDFKILGTYDYNPDGRLLLQPSNSLTPGMAIGEIEVDDGINALGVYDYNPAGQLFLIPNSVLTSDSVLFKYDSKLKGE